MSYLSAMGHILKSPSSPVHACELPAPMSSTRCRKGQCYSSVSEQQQLLHVTKCILTKDTQTKETWDIQAKDTEVKDMQTKHIQWPPQWRPCIISHALRSRAHEGLEVPAPSWQRGT